MGLLSCNGPRSRTAAEPAAIEAKLRQRPMGLAAGVPLEQAQNPRDSWQGTDSPRRSRSSGRSGDIQQGPIKPARPPAPPPTDRSGSSGRRSPPVGKRQSRPAGATRRRSGRQRTVGERRGPDLSLVDHRCRMSAQSIAAHNQGSRADCGTDTQTNKTNARSARLLVTWTARASWAVFPLR